MSPKPLPAMFVAPDMLVYSAEKGRLVEVRRLVLQGQYTQDKLDKALLAAVQNNHNDIVHFLLHVGADTRSREGQEALSCIAKSGELKMVWPFLEHGAEATTAAGVEVLLVSSLTGNLRLVRQLISMGAITSGRVGGKALINASQQGHQAVVETLLDASASASMEVSSMAMKEAAMMEQWSIVQLLMKAGIDSGAALRCAGAKGKRDITKKLLDMGCDPSRGLPAAASSGNIKVVKDILTRGVQPDAAAKALKEAARFGHGNIAKELLKLGVDPTCQASQEALTLAKVACIEAQSQRQAYEERVDQTLLWESIPRVEEDRHNRRIEALRKKEMAFQDVMKYIRRYQDSAKLRKVASAPRMVVEDDYSDT